jgi:hypothetical protein
MRSSFGEQMSEEQNDLDRLERLNEMIDRLGEKNKVPAYYRKFPEIDMSLKLGRHSASRHSGGHQPKKERNQKKRR